MAPPTSSVVAGWELALWLRQRREQLGLDAATVARSMGLTRNYWSAIENEHKIPTRENLAKAADILEFGTDEHQELLRLRAAARHPGWWADYPASNEQTLRYYGLEAGALSVCGFENLLFPGLLQIEDYVRAVMSVSARIPEVEVDQYVEVRLRRQDRLKGDDRLRLTYLMSEAVLLQEIGGRDVRRRQLQHVIDILEEQPNFIDVHIIPFSVQACELFGSSTFSILDFSSPRLPTIAWHETVTTTGIIDDRIQVRDITKIFNASLKLALSTQESIELLHRRL
ncbi:MAG TPA: helix-turn-helix transcriptional regulator [Pseudonocardiaceae bacterium]|jgi:transcriptional regulator with XRE-family HTH domain|nr:helix-turn-helix transcriptional regulator [Pseudonocardiaceae bacterium]